MVDYVPNARPGSRAPHRWLADGSSLYDRFGPWFTLLTSSAHAAAANGFAALAGRRGIPVQALVLDDPRLPELYQAAFTLIRPDQNVAWRSDTIPADADAVLDTVCGAGSRVPLAS